MQHIAADWQDAAVRLAAGEIGVIPTDTLYGIVGLASKPHVVERIFDLRRRDRDKALITLVSGVHDLDLFQIEIDSRTRKLFDKIWPGPVSAIVPVASSDYGYIHRGLHCIAFRVPAKPELLELIKTVGPIVAPSANLSGEAPAHTAEAAWAYFGDEVFYLNEGEIVGSPSALVDLRGERPVVLRPAPGFDVSMLEG